MFDFIVKYYYINNLILLNILNLLVLYTCRRKKDLVHVAAYGHNLQHHLVLRIPPNRPNNLDTKGIRGTSRAPSPALYLSRYI